MPNMRSPLRGARVQKRHGAWPPRPCERIAFQSLNAAPCTSGACGASSSSAQARSESDRSTRAAGWLGFGFGLAFGFGFVFVFGFGFGFGFGSP